MYEHDAIKLALLCINRGNKKTHVQADHKQDRGGKREPWDHLSGQTVKSSGC